MVSSSSHFLSSLVSPHVSPVIVAGKSEVTGNEAWPFHDIHVLLQLLYGCAVHAYIYHLWEPAKVMYSRSNAGTYITIHTALYVGGTSDLNLKPNPELN